MLCFPPAWVDGLDLASWATQLDDQIELVEITFPGHGKLQNQSPVTNINALAKGVADQIHPWIDRELVFFGHCMGALVAYETIRLLQSAGLHEPTHLFVSGAISPDTFVYPWAHLQPDDKICELMQTIDYPHIQALSSGDHKMRKQIISMLKADFEALATYRFRQCEPLNLPITAIGTREDLWTSPMAIRLWSQHTNLKFREVVKSGSHFNLPNAMPGLSRHNY